MQMPGRKFDAGSGYRYGFNGKENDNEVKGEGNQQDYGMRIYDPRVGRFLSVDPLKQSYPWLTPYQFASNSPVQAIDIDGKEGESYLETKIENGTEIVLHRVVELDVYLAITRDKNDPGHNFFVKDPKKDEKFKQDFRNDLAKHYSDGKFKDKDGNPVVFRFNIVTFDVAKTTVETFKNNLRDNEIGILKDAEGSVGWKGVIIQQSHLMDVKIPEDPTIFPEGETGFFSQPNKIEINDQQIDDDEKSHTIAHEIGHFMLRRHPDSKIKNMDDSPERHDMAGKGIFHYYKVMFEFKTSQINPGQNNTTQWSTPGKEDVNQTNVLEILKSVVDTGKRDVTPKQ